jgi:hypothetical protein
MFAIIVLGGMIVSLRDQPQSTIGASVIQITRVVPSIWPILFSGVLGNAVRALADFLAERGATMLVSDLDDITRS